MGNEVFHEGERIVQNRAGETASANRNSPMIGNGIPAGAIPFLEQQALLIFAVLHHEAIWCLPLAGKAGWITADRQSIHLDLDRAIGTVDQRILHAAEQTQPVGCIALDFATRRRLRINGNLTQASSKSLMLTVVEAYPNCPKYITQRTLVWSGHIARVPPHAGQLLTSTQRATIGKSDLFFIATRHPDRGLDASHRGGNPGFVQAPGNDLVRFPDYPGNSMFNTLGNLEIDPLASLLIPDFDAGQALAIAGTASVRYKDEGRTRWIDLKVRQWEEIPLPATDTARHLSPYNP